MYERTTSPQTIGGVLDDGFRLYRASLPQVLVLGFLAGLAGQLPNLFLPSGAGALAVGEEIMPTLLLVMAVSVPVSMFFIGAIIARIEAVAAQRPMTFGEACATGLKKMLPLLVTMVLYVVILCIGTLLLVIPGIILGLSLMFCIYAVVVDDVGPVAALGASHRLVWGNWWRTFVIVSVAMVILMVVYLLVGLVAGAAVAVGGLGETGVMLRVVELVVVPVLGALIAPLVYALFLAGYHDLRLRRTGTDLEQRLAATAPA